MFIADNAIILAAGFSSRLVPLCFDIPKGLLVVRGETLIERQIRQLKEIGINDIYIITGAYAQQFNFLKEKHNVKIIFNKDYATKNNYASIYAARDVLSNSIISSSDLYFPENIFQNQAEHSYYLSVFIDGKTNQRTLTLDNDDKIIKTKYGGENCWITFGGQAFFTKDSSKKLIKYIEPVYDNPNYANKYWVDFQDEHLKDMPMYIKKVKKENIIEFNTLESIKKFDKKFTAISNSKTMNFLCQKLNTKEINLTDFNPVKSGNCAIGCTFVYCNNKYMYDNRISELRILND